MVSENKNQSSILMDNSKKLSPKPILNNKNEPFGIGVDGLQHPQPTLCRTESELLFNLSQVNKSQITLDGAVTPPADGNGSEAKRANLISFDVPSSQVKHRGSISARPSAVNVSQITGALSQSGSSRNPYDQTQSPPPSTYASRQNSTHGNNIDSLQYLATRDLSALRLERDASAREATSSAVSTPVQFDVSKQHHLLHLEQDPTRPIPIADKKKKPMTKAIISTPKSPLIPFTDYLQREDDDKIHILIGATGSVATIKVPMIINKLFQVYGPDKVSIQLVVTKAADHFLRGLKISTEVKIWRDADEWFNPGGCRPGDAILHVELRKWADIFLVAPLSANTLAKISNGLCDNLLTNTIRSWNPTIPIFIAPAMNTLMYTHPITKKQLNILTEEFKHVTVLTPVEKVLMCGDIGMGGMREWSEIVLLLTKKIKEITKQKEKEREGTAGVGPDGKTGEEDVGGDVGAEDEDEDEDDDDDDDDEDDDDDDDDEDDDDDDDEVQDEFVDDEDTKSGDAKDNDNDDDQILGELEN